MYRQYIQLIFNKQIIQWLLDIGGLNPTAVYNMYIILYTQVLLVPVNLTL